MPTIRTQQVSSEILHQLTQIISKTLEISNYLITITRSEISPDLKYAKIFISVIPDTYRGSALSILKKNAHVLQKELGKTIRFYTVPKLNFYIDENEIKRITISEAIDQINSSENQ